MRKYVHILVHNIVYSNNLMLFGIDKISLEANISIIKIVDVILRYSTGLAS